MLFNQSTSFSSIYKQFAFLDLDGFIVPRLELVINVKFACKDAPCSYVFKLGGTGNLNRAGIKVIAIASFHKNLRIVSSAARFELERSNLP